MAIILYALLSAVYYSKVNPVISYYDYQDYLGGGRSKVDEDVVDIDDPHPERTASWFSEDWLKKAKYTMQFILDAIEKQPK